MNQLSNYPHLKWYVSNLRSIPGGSFRYGASPSQKQLGTRITMSPFRIGATPVTWGMWKEYRKTLTVPGKEFKLPKDPGWGYPDDHPAVSVSWDDIMNPGGFCEWASNEAGFKLTLPTDAQWEYSARGGSDGQDYPWGNDFDRSKIWFQEERFDDSLKKWILDPTGTGPVDRTNRIYCNGYGLTDMVGNVGQWCADFYNPNYIPYCKDPVSSWRTRSRYVRGAGWPAGLPHMFRCAPRSGGFPDWMFCWISFRLAASSK